MPKFTAFHDAHACNTMARGCIKDARNASDRAFALELLNIARTWIRLAQRARSTGGINFRAPVNS